MTSTSRRRPRRFTSAWMVLPTRSTCRPGTPVSCALCSAATSARPAGQGRLPRVHGSSAGPGRARRWIGSSRGGSAPGPWNEGSWPHLGGGFPGMWRTSTRPRCRSPQPWSGRRAQLGHSPPSAAAARSQRADAVRLVVRLRATRGRCRRMAGPRRVNDVQLNKSRRSTRLTVSETIATDCGRPPPTSATRASSTKARLNSTLASARSGRHRAGNGATEDMAPAQRRRRSVPTVAPQIRDRPESHHGLVLLQQLLRDF